MVQIRQSWAKLKPIDPDRSRKGKACRTFFVDLNMFKSGTEHNIMNVQLMTEDQYKVLISKIDSLARANATAELKRDAERLLDSASFEKLMGVSKPTAQAWRDEGLIAFSQVGHKIYYRMEDIEAFLKAHRNPAFKKGYKG